jgi:hypothetical protein
MTAAASWLIICALFIFAAPYLPRLAARVRAEREAERAWEAQLRADLLPLDDVGEDVPLTADYAAREAARIEREWKATCWPGEAP